MKRRFSSLLLACVLAVGLFVPAAAASFSDVASGIWYESAVSAVTEAGLMRGTSDTVFSPDGAVNRGMAATVLWRLAGTPQAGGTGAFPDVSADLYYASAVDWCAENGIVTGYDDGTFSGGDILTREQLAVLLYRYAVYTKGEIGRGLLENYPDAGNVSKWSQTGMAHAVGLGLITGREDGTLDPQGSATRAQLAVILRRLMTPAQG